MRSLLLLLMIVCISTSCSTDPMEGLVKDYLAEQLSIDAADIKIIDMKEISPWLAADSLKVIQEELIAKKDEMQATYEAAIEQLELAIEQGEKVKEGGFPALSELADETIEQSKGQIEVAKATIEALNSDFVGTTLEGLKEKVDHYTEKGEAVLYQVLSGTYSVNGEKESFDLVTDPEASSILGDLAQ